MRWIITPILALAIIWIMAAMSCETKLDRIDSVVWNRANASVPVEVIWNVNNPCYTGPCTTYMHAPRYRTAGTANPTPRTAPYNPLPWCWSCHGGTNWNYINYTTMQYHDNYNVQYGK